MRPDIRLIDIRVVLNGPGRAALSREFNVIAALSVRYLNSRGMTREMVIRLPLRRTEIAASFSDTSNPI